MIQSINWNNYFPAIRNSLIVFPLTCFIIWSLCYMLFGEELTFPGGSLFALGVLEVLAIILGQFAESIKMPPMLGMIAAGLLLRNVPFFYIGNDFDLNIMSPLRAMSVAVLLSRGAISVNPAALKKFKWIIPQLAVGSCVFEAIVASFACYFILGFPPKWAAAMGCIMSAMSQAGVMPYYLNLEKKGLGLEHDVTMIAKSACGLDAILAINMAECCFGVIFAYGDVSLAFQKGPLEVIMGAGFGVCWGVLVGVFLNDSHGSILRTFIVFICGSVSLLGFHTFVRHRGGPLGCWLGTLIAACFWRHLKVDGGNNKEVSEHLTSLWFIFQPLLFGIIGARTDFGTVDWALIERAFFCILISIIFRMCAAFALLCFAYDFTFYEKLFISFAWIPKGTVQAALGPVLLDTAIHQSHPAEVQDLANQVMSVSVLVIVMGSFIGSICLLTIGPLLLKMPSGQSLMLPS